MEGPGNVSATHAQNSVMRQARDKILECVLFVLRSQRVRPADEGVPRERDTCNDTQQQSKTASTMRINNLGRAFCILPDTAHAH